MLGLKHPNIVKIKGFFESDENVCIVLECIDGGGLLQHLKKYSALVESNCKALFLELLQAVDFLHQNNTCMSSDLQCKYILSKNKERISSISIRYVIPLPFFRYFVAHNVLGQAWEMRLYLRRK